MEDITLDEKHLIALISILLIKKPRMKRSEWHKEFIIGITAINGADSKKLSTNTEEDFFCNRKCLLTKPNHSTLLFVVLPASC